jgi:cytochrome c oxidase accessory protein FixG
MAKRRKLALPDDRPASFDESGHHVDLTAEYAQGRFRRRRDWVYLALVIVFLVIPWTKFQGHQTIMLDIPGRRFAFFGITFWSHDFPLVFFALGIITMSVTFMTAVWGRIWCGWACPQTVFIDFIYRRIEKWVEGNRYQRLKLAEASMSWSKLGKRSLKWILFWLVSANIAHSFTAYFVGAERLAGMSIASPWDNWVPFVFVSSLTIILMFDFGWFREQFCMIMCPYGRFQSVLLDQDSLAVLYDDGRGEPRKGEQPEGQDHGDCINCFKCVAVCPTGIDIRRGIQLECVACTACIDACDSVMEQIGKPEGLIRYATESEVAGGPKRRYFRFRTIAYGLILAVLVAGLSAAVAQRQILDVKFIRAVGAPYTETTLPDSGVHIINHYKVNLKNQSFETQEVELMLDDKASADGVEIVAPTYPLSIDGGEVVKNSVFLKFPKSLTKGSGNYHMFLVIKATSDQSKTTFAEEVNLIGPFS